MHTPHPSQQPYYRLAKHLFSDAFPDEQFVSQSVEDWCGEFALPAEVERYYLILGAKNVTIDNYGNPFFLPSLSHLWKFQEGYRFHPSSGAKFEDWSDDWLVIADQGGDPFIFSRSSGKILYALHGQGFWQADELFANLEAMVTTIAILGALVIRAGKDLTDDECYLNSRYTDEAREQIADIVGSDVAAETVLSALDWL
ncbi:hypothetical protein LEP3755_28220 [Leptolyngbya sp. NIES-3755]|nr:hypothetical protein LEP3755_28220 [Leptolyngbya sp. NIES-3755]